MTPGLKAWILSDLKGEEVKMKRFKLWLGIGLVSVLGYITIVHAASYYERYLVNGSEIWRLDNDGTTYQTGAATTTDLKLGTGAPSTTAFYAVKVPFYAAVAMDQGDVVISSQNGSGYGSKAAVLATTTVLGVCDGTYAAGSIGYMAVSGYALVLTTGTVAAGNVLVSTGGTNGTGAAGYAGVTTGTQVVGTTVGKAMVAGTAAGGLTLIKLAD